MKWRFFDRPGGEYVLHTLEEQGRVVAYAVAKRYSRDGVPYGHLLDCRTLSTAAPRLTDLLASVWRQLAEWDAQARFVLGTWSPRTGVGLSHRQIVGFRQDEQFLLF